MSFRLAALALALAASAPARAAEPDLSTPRRALRTFIDSARAGDYAAAAEVLDLPAARAGEGPRLARQLKFVLDQELWLDWDRISDEPEGDAADGPGADVVGTLSLGSAEVPVRVVRRGGGAWRLGPGVVAAIPALHAAHGPGWIGERMPSILMDVRFLDVQAWQWIGLLAALAFAAVAALVLGALARRIALRLARGTRVQWDDLLVDAASGPARLLVAIGTLAGAARTLRLAVPAQQGLDQLLRIAAVVAFTWAGLRAVRFGAEVLRRASLGADDGAARARLTQIMVLKRIAGFVVVVVGGALVLLQFEALRSVGTSLLASAGVAGLVVGLAAQRSIATLLAGLQISLTQPVRVGDVVIIEGEWGTIEEITLTYVVVKIWDLRRLVVPITRILDAPFQNWTRSGSDILGTVFLHADYRLPVDEVRRELERFVATRPEWDGKVVGVQVTGATDRTVEVRALVSSADASRNWDLRCAVREHLLAFLQRLAGGAYLPRTRIEAGGERALRNVVADAAGLPSGRPLDGGGEARPDPVGRGQREDPPA